MLPWTLALRYLFRKPITLFALVSVLLGTTAFVVVVGVMDGYLSAFDEKSRQILSDLVVMPAGTRIVEADNVCRIIAAASSDVTACSPIVEGMGLVKVRSKDGSFAVKWVRYLGVDAARERAVTGNEALAKVPPGSADWALPGAGLVEPRGIGDVAELTLVTSSRRGTGQPVKTKLDPVGAIEFGLFQYDREFAYVARPVAAKVAGLSPDEATGIRVRLSNPRRAAQVRGDIEAALKRVERLTGPLLVYRYQDLNSMFRALELQRSLAALVLGCLFVAAGFAVVAVTTMIVLQKTRDIGTVRALGLSRGGVLRTFVCYGVATSLAGVALGLALGVFVLDRIDTVRHTLTAVLGHEVFPESLYGMKAIPRELSLAVVLVIVAVAVVVSFLGSLLPAWRAARLNVVESLRYE
jgi:lipoprotein-releasing system permease protein